MHPRTTTTCSTEWFRPQVLTFTQITCFSSYLLYHSDLLRLLALLVQKYKYWHRVVSSTCTQFNCFTSTKVQVLTEWYGAQCLRPSHHARTAACSPSIRQVLTLLALLWYKRTRTDTRGGNGASSIRPHTLAAYMYRCPDCCVLRLRIRSVAALLQLIQ